MTLVAILVLMVWLCDSELKMSEFSVSDLLESRYLWNDRSFWDDIQYIPSKNGQYITKKCADTLCLCQDPITSEYYGCHEVKTAAHSITNQIHPKASEFASSTAISNYLRDLMEDPLIFGFEREAPKYSYHPLKEEVKKLFFLEAGDDKGKAIDAMKKAIVELNSKKFTDYQAKWGLKRRELALLHLYTETVWAGKIRKHFWQKNPEIPLPMIANEIYGATHTAKTRELIHGGLQLWMGFQYIDLPIRVGASNKNVGDTLEGAVFRGPWSSSLNIEKAETFAAEECDETKFVTTTAEGEVEGLVFEINIPAGTVDARLGAIKVETITVHPGEDEVLLYDIDGKYVKILKRCKEDGDSSDEVDAMLGEEETR